MSFHLVNPGGRIVAVDDELQYRDLLKQGYKAATREEEEEFIAKRREIIVKIKEEQNLGVEESIFVSTVTQNNSDGYSVFSDRIMKELRDLGTDIGVSQNEQKVALVMHSPYHIAGVSNPIKILYTMFESTKIPEDWESHLEEADLVIVPSKWCQTVFAEGGCNAMVIPLGYDDKTYRFIERKDLPRTKPFTFLHFNAFNTRKGFIEVFNAFNKAFEGNPNVRLLLKTTLKSLPIPIQTDQYPNIEVRRGEYTEKEMLDLMTESDCFVFPSRGEGFGMTPLESMATGLPALIPNAHGFTEYFNEDCMYEVAIKEMVPATYSKYKGVDVGEMFLSDEDQLKDLMLHVYNNQDEAYEKGKLAAEHVKQWTFAKTAVLLKEVLERYMAKPIEKKPIKNLLILEEI